MAPNIKRNFAKIKKANRGSKRDNMLKKFKQNKREVIKPSHCEETPAGNSSFVVFNTTQKQQIALKLFQNIKTVMLPSESNIMMETPEEKLHQQLVMKKLDGNETIMKRGILSYRRTQNDPQECDAKVFHAPRKINFGSKPKHSMEMETLDLEVEMHLNYMKLTKENV